MSQLTPEQEELLRQYQAARAEAEAATDGPYDQAYAATAAQIAAGDAFDATFGEDTTEAWQLRHPDDER